MAATGDVCEPTGSIPKRPFILVPLYIYPSGADGTTCPAESEAWEPLYVTLRTYPNQHVVVIINPANGPGPCFSYPDVNYVVALQRLAGFSNVTIIGYVYCSYGSRALSDLELDIRAYKAWTLQNELVSCFPINLLWTLRAWKHNRCSSRYWPSRSLLLLIRDYGLHNLAGHSDRRNLFR